MHFHLRSALCNMRIMYLLKRNDTEARAVRRDSFNINGSQMLYLSDVCQIS